MKFDKYPISETIKKNLSQLGLIRTTDIQFKSIPSIMEGEDVLAIAETGTGKTAAFAIPIIDKIEKFKLNKRSFGIVCIVMVPTHELAQQIGDVFKGIAYKTKVKVFSLFGGVEQDPQIRKLQDGIDILVTTPGRMFDLINQGYIRLQRVSTLILDEADHMLDLGFIEDIKYIKKMLPKHHQTLFFSATINKEIKKLAYSQVKGSAIRIQISPENKVSRNVDHKVMFVEMDDKRFFLERFIADHPTSKIIVFVRTRVRAERVVKAMGRVQIQALSIHGEKDQSERSDVMHLFKTGKCHILIATDVTARGIDIPDVNYVINYDLPEKAENYVHRVGRTGRGIKKGNAISFCSRDEKDRLEAIEGFLDKKIEVIKVGKKDYFDTLTHPNGELSMQEMIDEISAIETKKKQKKENRVKRRNKAFVL